MTTARWLSEEEQSLWRMILGVMRKIERDLDETLQQQSGITSSEYAVLVTLSESENDTARLRELCDSLDWDRSRVSHQVTRMERRGYVTKNKCDGDARGVNVQMTEEGRKRLMSAAPEHVETVRQLIFDHITEDQIEQLKPFFESILKVKLENRPG
ncbi:transcriptional regulator, MarR family protein [Corynebacterium kutscheri]|uniref:Transcriptional regulator n=1 Tax=Corynebacterium kutscheri TaxID=35755 RepID=A0A0F6R2H8_9CORY|nr:MarR family winged helix-turn-helix transcriptional regulator [Corynebacterium kutscheri]AKE41668.1 transcriptional regulator [Corynebacterium kutscheri]VEH09995.1 transcriptional regulator, MarR family protein [Corynebacterium kutscheri]VEH80074.1 transcriptional regulator, MarR family protein [Corynebacterium kutscheri]